MTVINMQTMRYINLLDKTSRVKTRKCFVYNNAIIFAVSRDLVSRAIGPNAENIKFIQQQIGKKIRIIAEARDISEANRFISDVVYPIKFNSVELKEGIFVLNAGNQSKAALIGRNKRRLDELSGITKDTFGFGLKII